MTRRPTALLLLLVTATLLAGCGSADADEPGTMRVEQVAVDEPANPAMAAVRLVIANGTDADDRLESVTSEVAASVTIHESRTVDGLATMTPRDAVEVAANSTVTFEAGGLHVMLEEIHEPLVVGESFTMTFHFAQAGAVDATAIVVDPSTTPESEHDHG